MQLSQSLAQLAVLLTREQAVHDDVRQCWGDSLGDETADKDRVRDLLVRVKQQREFRADELRALAAGARQDIAAGLLRAAVLLETSAEPVSDLLCDLAAQAVAPSPPSRPPEEETRRSKLEPPDDGELLSTLAVVQMLAPDARAETEIARDQTRTVQDRLEELFQRDKRYHGWSQESLGGICGVTRQAVAKAIAKSEVLTRCRIREIDD